MKLIADTGRCVGAGQCVLTEPALFDQSDEDGTVIILNETPNDDLADQARQATLICPSQALSLEE